MCIDGTVLIIATKEIIQGPAGVLGIWEGLFILKDLGSTGNYLGELWSKLIVLKI